MANLGNAYTESLERDVRGHFNGLVTGAVTLQELQRWLMEHEPLIEEQVSAALYADVVRVEHILAEYSGGHIGASVAVAEIARATCQPQPATLSSSSNANGG